MQRSLIDEYTTEEVTSLAQFPNALDAGETVRVLKFYVRSDVNQQGIVFYVIDMYLVALDGKRHLTTQDVSGGIAGAVISHDFGFHFRFVIPITPGYADEACLKTIAEHIDRYLVPVDEYLQQKKAAIAAVEAGKTADLTGKTEEEVKRILGEPQRTIKVGEKTLLKYADMTVELQNSKVVDVR